VRKTTIDLKSLFQVFKKNWVLIIAVAVIVMLLAVMYAKLFITPLYTSSIEVMVDNRNSTTNNPTNSEVLSSQELTSTYIVFMKNDMVLKAATEEVNNKYPNDRYSLGQVRSMLNFSQINNAMFIKITADTPSAILSRDLCIAVAQQAEKAIEATMGIDTIKIVGTASTPKAPSSPNIALYGLIGAVAGFAGCFVILLILAMRDNTIKDKHTVKEYFDLPFFGEIPSFDTAKGSRDYGAYSTKY